MYLQYNAVFRLLQVSLRVCTAIAFWCFLSTEVSSQPRVLRLIPYCRCAALDLRLVKSIAIRCFVVFWSLSSGQAFLCRLVRERDLRLGWGIDIGEPYFSLHYFNINVSDAPTDPQEVFLCIPFQIHCNVSVRRGLKMFEVTSCDTGSKRCLFVGRPSGIFVDRSLNSKTWLFAESCNQNKAIVCSLRIQLLFSANDSGKDGKGSRVGQTIIPIHRIHKPLLYRSYAYTTIIRHDTAYTNNMIPVCIYSCNVFTCLFCIPCDHSMHASRPGTLSADELRKQSEMAKMVPCP